MPYRHIFFDLDHTLWDFEMNAKATLKLLYEEFELASRKVETFEDFHAHYMHHNEVLWERYRNGYISHEDLKWKRMWRALLEFKVADEPLAREMGYRFLEVLPTQQHLFPYTREILDYLQMKSYRLHLITNGFEVTQHRKLKNSNLAHYFDHVITSEGAQSLKPKKEIFEYALQKAGTTREESIMIGDMPDVDIQGAINAGMDQVWVKHVDMETDIVPTYTITHLKQLESIL